ncbi:zinc-binding dehydrogenase [Burkholderia gladioli]|uniref:Alcohol dehydrogenase zinc-binding domain-containing protein n=1 Tax=Burkholderia gladioli (strain BSR3) TaxID=999541 RepID=F2LPV9_BURGS|nr:zinc-binding dehydrogenase [Burkholderia gladioli]AEA64148.1 alcohol dehydrogenase zinc-binding domain-containing protein [Burkholderia gladioli BSR3]MBW5284237.1 zinc-binding dehydrogenase [Burkholderia gladioli]
MRAIVLDKFGGLDSLVYREIPDPEPLAGHVVIEVKAFGINHAEMHMRRGEWAESAPVSGIECVGIVKSCPGGEFPVGAKVAALMGGLDPIRDFNPLLQMASGVYLSFFGSFVFGTPGFPLSDVPLQAIAADAAAGRLDVKPSRVFGFDQIHEAHRVMEANQAGGKMVVR